VKILHVYKDYPPVVGGIEGHLRSLAVEQSHCENLDVDVLVTNRGYRTVREFDEGVRVTKAGRQLEVARTPLSWQLVGEMASAFPDITHLHMPYPMGELAQLLVGRSRRLVVTYHSDVVRQRRLLPLYGPVLRRVLGRADRIITTSRRYADSSPFLAPFREKCVVVPLGIDPARFQSPDAQAVAAVKAKWPGPLVLFVGTFRYYKGLPYLVEAAQWIRGTVLLVGDGPVRAAIGQHVEYMGPQHKVCFAGTVSDKLLPAYYAAADVFVLPSSERSEAFGIVQLEAMASARPVVSTELGTGTSYVNVHGETGLVVPARDARSLAGAVNSLLADPALRTRYGAAGRERVAQEFTKQCMVERVAALYRSLT
jgi:glycosyltransferase involved in cell wall biosynthesis